MVIVGDTHDSAGFRALVRPRNPNRMSKDILPNQALSIRNGNMQGASILPADHPHAKAYGTENMAPDNSGYERQPRSRERVGASKDYKRSKSAVSIRSLVGRGDESKSPKKKDRTRQEQSPKKNIKKTKSSTGLSALFGKRNKSSKDLSNTEYDETIPITPTQERMRNPRVKDDVSDDKILAYKAEIDRYTPREYNPYETRDFNGTKPSLSRPGSSQRPQSAILTGSFYQDAQTAMYAAQRETLGSRGSDSSGTSTKSQGRFSRPLSMFPDLRRQVSGSSTEDQPAPAIAVTKRGSRVAAAVAAINSKSSPQKAEPPKLDPAQVEEDFEAVLERRNIPEDQRRSMRSLTLHVKADFVKQDEKTSRPSSPVKSNEPPAFDMDQETGSPSKRDRPRSRTFNFTKSDTSPTKKQRASSRPRSVQDVTQITQSPHSRSSSRNRSIAVQALPQDYVAHLKSMQDPTQAEVGRVHKLRILLRNETVEWVHTFVELGGMDEIIGLLQRIMAIEWREEHEDQLLHETLLCLKGISTTKIALQRLSEVADTLFPQLLGMLFDEEKKGPSEFSTRTVIITILFTYLSAALPNASARARQILTYLSDNNFSSTSPLPFVAEMHTPRPYRTWCKEATNVTKEVFWIFLHQSNVITPSECDDPSLTYAESHFPGTRAPVPAAPYIGGVEWDATTYLAAHLDLLNGLIASLDSAAERNVLRENLRASGWEKLMARSLRTCKEKFYAMVHDGLRCWVRAAREDGWEAEYVATGKGGDEIPSPIKAGGKDKVELPTLGLGARNDLAGWLE